MQINWLEWMGYIASAIILISLVMSSIKRLRWINTVGSCVFAAYGILIGSVPVAVMNFGIVLINAWYLRQMYSKKEYFSLLPVSHDSDYLKKFLKFYEDEINSKYLFTSSMLPDAEICFFVLRDMQPAGLFICSKHSDDALKIELDFATPQYRDFKIGRYIFSRKRAMFTDKGYKKLIAFTDNPSHEKYLNKMGFVRHSSEEIGWVLEL